MKRQDFIMGSIIAIGIAIAIICTGLVTGSSPGNPPVAGSTGQSQDASTDPVAGTFIHIDPVADKNTGDLLIVTGSTDLPAGTALMVVAGNNGQNTEVRAGSGGINRFSAPVDTSVMKPGMLNITVSDMIGSLAQGNYRPGSLTGKASFTLRGIYRAVDIPVTGTAAPGDYIRLDAIGDRSLGDQFVITGTTSLPTGTEVLLQIMPDIGVPRTQTDRTALGAAANSIVTRGDGTTNRISFAVDMNGQKPGKWVVLVGKMSSEPFVVEDPVATEYFRLK